MTAKELREKRGSLIEQMKQINDTALEEKRNLSGEEEQQWNALDKEQEGFLKRAEQIEKQDRLNAESAEKEYRAKHEQEEKRDGSQSDEEIEKRAFDKFLRRGMNGLTSEEQQVLMEKRAQAVGTDAAGGFTAPDGFVNRIESALLEYGGMRQVAQMFNSSDGNSLQWPTEDNTAQEGQIVGENLQHPEQDVVFGDTTLTSHTYSSKIIRTSVQLLQDSAFNMEGFLQDKLVERIGRITERHFTAGSGTGEPQGALTGSAKGADAAMNAIGYDNLIDLEHSIDPAYRRSGSVRFMFHDSTLKALKKIKDSGGQYIWTMGDVKTGAPDSILNYRYTINQYMDEVGAGTKPVLFGDFNKYVIRNVKGITMVRFGEKYMDFLQVGFLAYARFDGKLIQPQALKHLLNAAV